MLGKRHVSKGLQSLMLEALSGISEPDRTHIGAIFECILATQAERRWPESLLRGAPISRQSTPWGKEGATWSSSHGEGTSLGRNKSLEIGSGFMHAHGLRRERVIDRSGPLVT